MDFSLSATSHADYGLGPLAGNAQRGQDVLDAAYAVVHGYPGGVAALALRMGMSANTLKHKVNPNNNTHHLSLREAVMVQELANSAAILHCMADALGYTCARATPGDDAATPIDVMAALYTCMADLQHAVADGLHGDRTLSINQMRRIDHHAQESIAAISNVLALMRSRMRTPPEATA